MGEGEACCERAGVNGEQAVPLQVFPEDQGHQIIYMEVEELNTNFLF